MKMCLGILVLLFYGHFLIAQEPLFVFPNEKLDGKLMPYRTNFIKFSDDSTLLAACGNYKVSLIEIKTGKILWKKANAISWSDCSFSSNNKYLALVERFGLIRIFETDNFKQLHEIKIDSLWQAKYFGQHLAVSSCANKEIRILDSLNDFREILKIQDKRFHNPELVSLDVKDGKVNGLIIGGGIFKINQGILKFTEKLDQKIWTYNVKSDRLLVSSGDIWQGGNNWQVMTIAGKEKNGSFQFEVGFDSCWCFSPDGELVALGGKTVETRVYSSNLGKMVFSISSENGQQTTAIAISTDGKLAIGSTGGVKIYSIK